MERNVWSGVWPESGLYRFQLSNSRNRIAKRHPLHVWAFNLFKPYGFHYSLIHLSNSSLDKTAGLGYSSD